jgi:phenylacetate-CoA ligase
VWVFGRSFWAVSLYGANVYVEQVMPALEGGGGDDREDDGDGGVDDGVGGVEGQEGEAGQGRLADLLTGKFVLYVEEDSDHNPRLALRVEVARGVEASGALAARVARAVRRVLLRLSSEYAAYVPREAQLPLVKLHEQGDPEWFPVGVKHRYTLA